MYCNCSRCNGAKKSCTALGPFIAVDAACIPSNGSNGSNIPSDGSMLAFTSGITPTVLTSVLGGVVGTTSAIGLGTALPGINIVGNTLDLTDLVVDAVSVSKASTITAISASYSLLAGLSLVGTTTTINATVFRAPEGSNLFTATSASVNLDPPLTGVLNIGDVSAISTSIAPVPVAVGDRLMVVFSITATGLTLVQTVTGSASATLTMT